MHQSFTVHISKELIKTTINVTTTVIPFILTDFLRRFSDGKMVACFWSSLLCSLFFCHPWSLVHMPLHCSTLLPHHLASPHRQSLTWYLATNPLIFMFFSRCPSLPCFLHSLKVCIEFHGVVQFQIQRTKPIFTETKMAHGQSLGITSWHWVSPHVEDVFLLLLFCFSCWNAIFPRCAFQSSTWKWKTRYSDTIWDAKCALQPLPMLQQSVPIPVAFSVKHSHTCHCRTKSLFSFRP